MDNIITVLFYLFGHENTMRNEHLKKRAIFCKKIQGPNGLASSAGGLVISATGMASSAVRMKPVRRRMKPVRWRMKPVLLVLIFVLSLIFLFCQMCSFCLQQKFYYQNRRKSKTKKNCFFSENLCWFFWTIPLRSNSVLRYYRMMINFCVCTFFVVAK